VDCTRTHIVAMPCGHSLPFQFSQAKEDFYSSKKKKMKNKKCFADIKSQAIYFPGLKGGS